MFSLLFRDTARALRSSLVSKCYLPNAVIPAFDYSTFTTSDFIYENSDETATLLTRFVKYLAMENSKFDPIVQTTIRYPDFFPVEDSRTFKNELNKIDVAQVPHLIIFAFTYKSNGDPQKFVRILNEVDTFCENNLQQMDYDTILRTLYAFMFLMPNKITKTSFYNAALQRLVDGFNKELPKEKFVKACFYLGLGKKNKNSTILLNKFISINLSQYVPELTAMDLSIIGNAAFKASLQIENPEFLKKITSELLELDSVIDDALLVNLTKVMRINRIKSTPVCEKLDAICTEKVLRDFQTPGIAHIFAYFAESQWNNKKTCSMFINEAMCRIRESPKSVRAKDLATFLWCCAHLQLGQLLTENDLRCIAQLAQDMVEHDEYKYFSDQLIDTTLCLWMLGHHSRGLVAEVTSMRVNPTLKNPDRVKLDTRHKVLISCIAIEKPEWLLRERKQVFIESHIAPDFLVKSRVGLKKAFEKLKSEGVDAKFVSPIEGINIAGMFVELSKDQKCYLEVLENEHILRFNDVPSALMQLKIRLLKHLGYNVAVIRANEVESMSSISDVLGSFTEAEVKTSVVA